jgi:dienelactone hydrolase
MNKIILLLILNFILSTSGISQHPKKNKDAQPIAVTFPSLDTLGISALVYEIDKTSPAIVLCHQAGYNKFEYDGIARELNKRGFNCLAIDQRSGGPISSMQNETVNRALQKNKETSFFDAEQDIVAAINYTAQKYKKPVILWGSSYSSTFALYLGRDNQNVLAVVAFSPGNYFEAQKGSLVDFLSDYKKPFFITSSKQEIPSIKELLKKTNFTENQTWFQPSQFGRHGSSSLWDYPYESNEYWKAVNVFLDKLKM